MKKYVSIMLLSAGLLVAGLMAADAVTADVSNPSVAYVCGDESNGVKKGPDVNGKVSIKCFVPKGEWKNNGKGKISCKGELTNSPGLGGECDI